MKTSIIICKGSGHVTILAETITIQGFQCAAHKSIGKSGWSVSSVEKGLAFVIGKPTKTEAIREAERRILNVGTDKVRETINASPPLPSTAPIYESKPSTPAVDAASIVDLIAKTVGGLTERERAAVSRALNSRTGQLKAKSPSAFGDADERLACAAWQGIQPNAFKTGLVSLFAIGHHAECQSLYTKLSKVQWPAAFDKDKLTLVNAGVW